MHIVIRAVAALALVVVCGCTSTPPPPVQAPEPPESLWVRKFAAALSPDWTPRSVPEGFRRSGLVASSINAKNGTRIYLWREATDRVPANLAEGAALFSERSGMPAQITTDLAPPDASVILMDPTSGRGEFMIFLLMPDKSVMTIDIEFAPEDARSAIAEAPTVVAKLR